MLKIYQLRLPQNTFEVTLKYRGVGVRVSFTDGNNYRDIPAKCYTNDPFKQRAIEASKMFKDKDIVLERTVAEKSDQQKKIAPKPSPAPNPSPEPSPAPNPSPEPPQAPNQASEQTDDNTGNEMTFDGTAEAIQYIATNFGEQVQTVNEARKFLKDKGIVAHIKQG